MPVAAEKHTLQDLTLTITLDDGDSPMPTQKLSELEEVEVFARLSSSGEAMRQEGDVDLKPVRVALPASGPVELVLGTNQSSPRRREHHPRETCARASGTASGRERE